ncbi:hypothetical protein [Streptomyces sp. NPDC094149]|uniref:hypothetical protein n=1 Tax=Streptomyces sp. NPDC094149 TaxID=3155079 RepID=UPI00332BAEDC
MNAEDLLWQPDLQQGKHSQNGAHNVRDRIKADALHTLRRLISTHAPWLRVRYAL